MVNGSAMTWHLGIRNNVEFLLIFKHLWTSYTPHKVVFSSKDACLRFFGTCNVPIVTFT